MTGRSRIHLWASRLHKWLAIVIGVQLLIWFASGALMSFLPIDQVRGEHLVDRAPARPVPRDVALVAPGAILSATEGRATSLLLTMVDGRPTYVATTPGGTLMFDATNGAWRPPIDASAATEIATRVWKRPPAPRADVSHVTTESTEYKGALPAWRVAFSDPDRTDVFVSAADGRIAAVRTKTWRLYDFFWGLHIMDWWGHEDFNTPWLLAFAIGGLALWIAGAVLLGFRWPRRRRRGRGRVRRATF